MKKLINATDTVLTESLDGFVASHSDIVSLGDEYKFVRRKTLKPGKVALISGGGSGHEPLHAGFVGHGMLDAACPGQVFTSPTPDQMMAAAEAVDQGAGVLYIVKNYEGDVMNFEIATEMLNYPSAIVLVDDDVIYAGGIGLLFIKTDVPFKFNVPEDPIVNVDVDDIFNVVAAVIANVLALFKLLQLFISLLFIFKSTFDKFSVENSCSGTVYDPPAFCN
jgi:hypothetical protein